MIALEDVSFAYGQKPVLQAVSLRFPKSGAVCLFGASGCGKTTLLRLLSGLEKPDKGRLTGLEGKRTAMLFQEDRLLPWLSVLETVAVVLEGPDARARAADWLELVGLADAAHKRPAALSGGMRRRAALARALAVQPDVLLLDEPFSGVDEASWRELAGYIAAGYADRLVVLVTHIRAEAEQLGAAVLELPPAPLTGRLTFGLPE